MNALYEIVRTTKIVVCKSGSIYRLESAVPADRRCSSTGKELLLSALRDSSVYKVRENRTPHSEELLPPIISNLILAILEKLCYRDIPREAFDIGMIFLHELAHRHLEVDGSEQKCNRKK